MDQIGSARLPMPPAKAWPLPRHRARRDFAPSPRAQRRSDTRQRGRPAPRACRSKKLCLPRSLAQPDHRGTILRSNFGASCLRIGKGSCKCINEFSSTKKLEDSSRASASEQATFHNRKESGTHTSRKRTAAPFNIVPRSLRPKALTQTSSTRPIHPFPRPLKLPAVENLGARGLRLASLPKEEGPRLFVSLCALLSCPFPCPR